MATIFYIIVTMCVAIVTGVLGHAYGYYKAERIGKQRLVKANELHVANVRAIDNEHAVRIRLEEKTAHYLGYHLGYGTALRDIEEGKVKLP